MKNRGKAEESLPELSESDEQKPMKPTKPRDKVLSPKMQLRCLVVLKFLFDVGTSSERNIRQKCGDNPDTSKALRLLHETHKVRRFGTGGRLDPFIYAALATPNMSELKALKQARDDGII